MYLVFEGVDGVGKSTQIELLKREFSEAVFTCEPGGTPFGEALREILLESKLKFSKRAEILLFLADRAEHYEKILRENNDKIIISDRSFISGIAYANKSVNFDMLLSLNAFALNDFFPQKCVFLRADEDLLRTRLENRPLDKIEKRGISYFLAVQNELENCLEILQNRTNLSVLKLDAREEISTLHKKIVRFIKS